MSEMEPRRCLTRSAAERGGERNAEKSGTGGCWPCTRRITSASTPRRWSACCSPPRGDAQVRAPKPVAWALRFGQHTADSADLVAGALRIRGRMVLNRIRRARWFSRTVRDQRWSDALAVVSVVAPLLLLVAALTEVHIPQAAASSVTGHPHWQLTGALGLADLPLAAGAPAVAVLAFLRLRRTAGMVALAAAIGQVVSGILRSAPAFTRYESPAVAFTVLLACTAAAALLLSPGPDRGLALLTPGRHRAGGSRCADPRRVQRGRRHVVRCRVPPSFGFAGFRGEVAGLPGDLLIAGVLVTVAAACLRAPVSRRVLALLAIPVIPYAVLWQEKLAGDLFGSPNGGASTLIPSSVALIYLLPLILACAIVAGTRLARRRATGRARQVGSTTTPRDPGAP